MKDIKPIKRTPHLQPLSREHHDGLLFVWKIKQGISNNTELDRLRKYVGWFWRSHMRPHFFQEENILAKRLPAGHLLSAKLKTDHNEIRELMISIDREAELYDLKDLANLVEVHIRWEEREFFEYLEHLLTEEELEIIFKELEKHPVNCTEEWPDEFWIRKSA